MSSSILCNYCKRARAYYISNSGLLAACALCMLVVTPIAKRSHFKHWSELERENRQPVGDTLPAGISGAKPYQW